jgi:putative FmdB family regulatory protein
VPIYEYRCLACKRRTSVFVRSVSSPASGGCDHCGSKKLSRLMSKFAVHKPGIDFDNPASMDSLDESDPRAMARMMRQMGEESGEDMGSEFEQMLGRIESGEDPDSVMAESGDGDDGAEAFGDDDF